MPPSLDGLRPAQHHQHQHHHSLHALHAPLFHPHSSSSSTGSTTSSSRLFDSPPSRRGSAQHYTNDLLVVLPPPANTTPSRETREGSQPPQPQFKVPGTSHRSRQGSLSSSAGMTIPPPLANGQKGSLPEFAAQITCFLWFESSYLLHRVEESSLAPVVQAPLATDAVPSVGFRKWLATILSTTQVSQNVVLLALLFVYRLKKLNPTVKGKTGSEFRLITVALMLGNKFLDDNTYTNKTWAEVSGITVQEIHIMEVEFLQNMKYNLFTSEVQWREWHVKLHRFWKYWSSASQTTFNLTPRATGPISPLPAITPSLPSPPNSQVPSPAFMTGLSTHSPTRAYPQYTLGSSPKSSITPPPLVDLSNIARKRSYDGSEMIVMEPPAKRVTRSMAPNISVSIPHFPMQIPPPLTVPSRYSSANPSPELPKASGASHMTMPSIPSMNFGLTLPELGSRSMSMVYPNQMSSNAQPGPTSSGSMVTHNISIPAVGSQSRNSSPFLQQHHSNNSSPISAYPNQQPQHLSPSYFLGNRSSPYRPVRGVSALLVPQTQAPAPPPMNMEQIQYQPLTKSRSQYKSGILPYSTSELAWGPSTHKTL
ncbi:cyclin-domain-containing protein [Peziza echinospora]|nr:cyclin-domain-containing protein [Peziza echinospora]